MLRQICEIYAVQGYETNVLAASLRHPMHVIDAALAGADIATMPYDVFTKLVKHPLTDHGLDKFQADWTRAPERAEGRGIASWIRPQTEAHSRASSSPSCSRSPRSIGIEGTQKLRKAGLIDAIVSRGGNGERTRAGPPRPQRNGAASANGERRCPTTPARADDASRGPGRRATADRAPGLATRRAPTTAATDRGDADAATSSGNQRPRQPPRRRRPWRPAAQPGPRPNRTAGQPDRGGNQDRDRADQVAAPDRDRQTATGTVERDRDAAAARPARSAGVSARSAASARRPIAPRRSRPRRCRTGILDILPEGYGFLRTAGYLPGSRGRLRVAVAGAQALAPQGRHRHRQGPRAARTTRSTRRCCRSRPSTTWTPRRRVEAPAVRQADAAVPRTSASGSRTGPLGDRRAHHRHGGADRQGPARHGRLAAEGGQDHDPQADRQRHHGLEPRDARHRAAGRRAARGGHRLAAHGARRPRSCTRRSTSRPTSTSRSPSSCWSAPSAWPRRARTSRSSSTP